MVNKKGISTIVVTVILVALSLVAVGVVWAVVSGVIGSSTSSAEIADKCLKAGIAATGVTCDTATPAICSVTFERSGTNNEVISGIALVFKDTDAGTISEKIDNEDLAGLATNVERLVPKKIDLIPAKINTPSSVEVTVYFNDKSGNPVYCPTNQPFNF
jgi:hypothetical protein